VRAVCTPPDWRERAAAWQGSSENQLEEGMVPAMTHIAINPIAVRSLPARFRDNAMRQP